MKRSYSGVGALSLASLMSQRTLVSACQLLSCLSGPPWATFAPQLNAAWITDIEMLCQEEHALHDIEDLWNRRLELGESQTALKALQPDLSFKNMC